MAEMVTLTDVHKDYLLGETRVQALRGISFSLRRGEFTALIGASGSGKSTLLNLVGCVDVPTSGAISFDGVNVATLSDDRRSQLRNRKIGFVFQTFNLIPVLNVYENIEIPLLINPSIPARERKSRIKRAITDVGLQDFVQHVPDKLSGGQRQRVAIARALINEPDLILADEPTAALDSTTANKIVDLLLHLNETRGVTFLFSTHDEKLMGRVRKVVHLRDGQVAM